jgi:hypothetical protein
MAVIIPPTPISDFPGPLPNVVDSAFRQQALQWVNHLTTVKIGEFNALLANVNNNATVAYEQAQAAQSSAADAAASAVDAESSAASAASANGYATAAAASASAASTSESNAAASASTAGGSASAASDASTKAGLWAEEAVDVAVEPGKYSAKHWAAKAADVVAGGVISDATTGSVTTWSSSKINTLLGGKEPSVTSGTSAQYWRGDKSWQTLNSSAVGLGNVDNTSDLNKPVSTSAQTALNGKAANTTTLTDGAAASTLPATSSSALSALLQTTRDCLKWLVNNTVQLAGAQSIAGVKTFSNRSSHAGAYTPSTQPAHSATPTFDCATSNVFEPAAMTGNVTSITLSNAAAGQTVQIRFLQDGTGSRTVAVPSGAKVDGAIQTGANQASWLILTYSARASRWEGNWLKVPA